jgi:hypothetical protein
MQIETTTTQYVIRLDRAMFTPDDVDRILRNLRVRELASRLGGTQEDADSAADELMEQWWSENRPAK